MAIKLKHNSVLKFRIMKKKKIFAYATGLAMFCISLFSTKADAQVAQRFPDGRVVYQDGTIVYPNGQVQHPNGKVVYQDSRNRNGQWIPPGQAKKRYGKNKGWKKDSDRDHVGDRNRDRDRDGDHDNNKHHDRD